MPSPVSQSYRVRASDSLELTVVKIVWRLLRNLPISRNLRVVRRPGVGRLVCLVLLAGLTAAACSKTATDPAAGGGGRGGRGGRGGARGGAQPVVTTKVTQRDVPVDLAAVGNVEAYTSVSVRSQVTGQLQETFFHEGDIVKKGDSSSPSTRGRSKPRCSRPKPIFSGSGAPHPGRSAARSRLGQCAPGSRGEAPGRPGHRRSRVQGGRRAIPRGRRLHCVDDQCRQGGDSKCERAVVGPEVRRRERQGSVELRDHPVDYRRPDGNNTVKVGNLVTSSGAELVTFAPAADLCHVRSAGHALALDQTPDRGEPLSVVARLRTAILSRSMVNSLMVEMVP